MAEGQKSLLKWLAPLALEMALIMLFIIHKFNEMTKNVSLEYIFISSISMIQKHMQNIYLSSNGNGRFAVGWKLYL